MQLCRDPKLRTELFRLPPEGFGDDPRMFLEPKSARIYHKEIVKEMDKSNTDKNDKSSTSVQPDKPTSVTQSSADIQGKAVSTTQGVMMEVDKPTSMTQSLVDTQESTNNPTCDTQGVTSTLSLSQTQPTTLRNKASPAIHDLGHKNKGSCFEKVTIATLHTPGHTSTPPIKPVKQTSANAKLNSQPRTQTSHANHLTQNVHKTEQRLCQDCGKTFEHSSSLSRHKRMTHGKTKGHIPCNNCDERYAMIIQYYECYIQILVHQC